MKKINSILKKCKTLSRQLGRTTSYSSLRSKSDRHHRHLDAWDSTATVGHKDYDEEKREAILVGSNRKRFLIKSKYLDHPLVKAIIKKSGISGTTKNFGEESCLWVKCESLLFEYFLLMIEESNPNLPSHQDDFSWEEIVDLYL